MVSKPPTSAPLAFALDDDLFVLEVPGPDFTGAGLTPAESAVVTLAAEGLSNSEIASAREVSTHTVANQLASSYKKLGVQQRSELIGFVATPAGPDDSL